MVSHGARKDAFALVNTPALLLEVEWRVGKHVRILALHHRAHSLLEALAHLVHVDWRSFLAPIRLVLGTLLLRLGLLHLRLLLGIVDQVALVVFGSVAFLAKLAKVVERAISLLELIAVLSVGALFLGLSLVSLGHLLLSWCLPLTCKSSLLLLLRLLLLLMIWYSLLLLVTRPI